jgi:hypothetical protein
MLFVIPALSRDDEESGGLRAAGNSKRPAQ